MSALGDYIQILIDHMNSSNVPIYYNDPAAFLQYQAAMSANNMNILLELQNLGSGSGGTNSNVLIDCGTFLAPNENVLIECGGFI